MGVKERKAQEKQTRQDQILKAARTLLFSQSVEEISINKISKKAELGVGTIYFYFKSKEDIFIALQEEGVDLLHETIQKICAGPLEPGQKLQEIANAYYDFTESQKEYFNIINHFMASPKILFKEELKQRIDMSAKRILAIIQDIVVTGIQSGVFQDDNPEKFSIMFWGTIHGLLQFKKFENTLLQGQVYTQIYQYSVEKLIQGIALK